MAATAQQLIALATQEARTPGFTVQGGLILNRVLQELSQTYDVATLLNTTTISLTAALADGPYSLPANYMRMFSDHLYITAGAILIKVSLLQYDQLKSITATAGTPVNFTTDVSPTVPLLFVWPPPSSTISLKFRYYGSVADIAAPETSTTIPWFPCQGYLAARLRGELMAIAGDSRYDLFLGDSPMGAAGILRRWLHMQGDRESDAQQILTDRRTYGQHSNPFPPPYAPQAKGV